MGSHVKDECGSVSGLLNLAVHSRRVCYFCRSVILNFWSLTRRSFTIECKIFLIERMSRSQTPPWRLAAAGLNFQSILL